MKLFRNLIFGAATLLVSVAVAAPASQFWEVEGQVIDRADNQPVVGAKVMVFLDESEFLHDGLNAEGGDYPDLPATSSEGTYLAKTLFTSVSSASRPLRAEVVVIAPGYRTRRIIFKGVEIVAGEGRSVKLPAITLETYESLKPENQLML